MTLHEYFTMKKIKKKTARQSFLRRDFHADKECSLRFLYEEERNY